MWFRAALLIIFWLLVYRFVMSVLRQLSAPRNQDRSGRGAGPSPPPPGPKSPQWDPSDVIDVPFREVPGEGGSSEDKDRQSRATRDGASR